MNRHVTLMIVHGALCSGLLAFGVFVFLQVDFTNLTFVFNPVDIFIPVTLAIHFIAPAIVASGMLKSLASGIALKVQTVVGREPTEQEMLFQVYQTKMIVGCAIAEGTGFYCLVMLMTRNEIQLVIGAIAALVLCMAAFPFPPRVESWVSSKADWLKQERQLQ